MTPRLRSGQVAGPRRERSPCRPASRRSPRRCRCSTRRAASSSAASTSCAIPGWRTAGTSPPSNSRSCSWTTSVRFSAKSADVRFVFLRASRVFVAMFVVCSLTLLAGQGPPSDLTAFQIIVLSSAEEAEQVRAQVTSGRDFTVLARDKSIDPTARVGGHLGKLSVASLRPELRDALQGLKAGELTTVVRIPTGYAIVRIVPEAEALSVENDPARTLAALATGATRDAIPVAGLTEADTVFLNTARGDGWNEDLRQICQIRTDSMKGVLDRLEVMLGPGGIASDASRATPSEVFEARYALAQLHAYTGNL